MTKLVSWNVNGIRSVLGKGALQNLLQKESPDILCLQEIKAESSQVELPLEFSSYTPHWNSAEKKGYSGTAIFTKKKPLKATYGLGISHHDKEGRVINLEFEDYFLVNVYTPNSKRALERLPYRTREWDVDFLKHVKKMEKTKPVIFCGDLNVAHKEIDLARPSDNRFNAGFTDEERASFDHIVKAGFLDTFREFSLDGGNYTWWSFQTGVRSRNIGWRIDYFCISPKLRKRLKSAMIHAHVAGSDHCPVSIDLE
ncbi:MAG: exodeoxyribonuclease III [Candidatus Omnitrophica bacterium]|nr:exodeoxyribonuclease III [Candidatus Omnitrophota bacterium]